MPKDLNKEEKPSRMPFQSKKNRKTVVRVMGRFESMKEQRQEHGDEQWDEWDRLRLNIPSREPDEDWQANVFVPFVMSTILAIYSEITSRRTRWKLMPMTSEDEPKVELMEAITDFTLEKGHWDDESLNRDMDKLTYGTSIWKEVYRQDRRIIRERKINKDGTEVIKEKDIRDFDDVYGHHVPIRNFYVDDKATDIRNARDCVERTIVDIRDFKTKYGKYKLSNKVKRWGFLKPSVSEEDIQNIPAGGDTNNDADFIPESDLGDNEVEVIEYWNKSNDEHIIVANGVLVVDEPNPYDHKQLPYAIDICIPKPGAFYGMGIPESLYPLQEEINTLHNQMLDEGHLSIHPPIIMDGMTILDEDEYKIRPGGIIPTDGGTAVQLNMRGIGGSHFQLLEETKQAARVASGLDVRFAEGISQPGNDTATEIIRLQEASLRRIGLLTKMLEIKCLPRIGMLRTMNIQQFYKDPLRVQKVVTDGDSIKRDETTGETKLKKTYRTIRVADEGRVGYEFKEIKPEDIRGNFDVHVVPQSTQPMSQSLLIKRLNVALNTVLQSEVALEIVNVAELFRHFFKELNLPRSMVNDILDTTREVDFQLAQQENLDMADGTEVRATSNPSMKHTMVHYSFVYELDEGGVQTGRFTEHFQQLPPETQKIFFEHITGEEQQHKAKGNIASNKARTANRLQGTGTQTTPAGSEIEVSAEGV